MEIIPTRTYNIQSWFGHFATKTVLIECLWVLSVHGSLRSCPLPIIPLCLSREEGMIHFFVGSHVKMPDSGLFSDWLRNNTSEKLHSDWLEVKRPKEVSCFLQSGQWFWTRTTTDWTETYVTFCLQKTFDLFSEEKIDKETIDSKVRNWLCSEATHYLLLEELVHFTCRFNSLNRFVS